MARTNMNIPDNIDREMRHEAVDLGLRYPGEFVQHLWKIYKEGKKEMKRKFYREAIGECVSQVYEVEADDWNEAKKAAFDDMAEGDILAECPPEAVKQDGDYPEYSYIDEDMCEHYATLCKGAWEGNKWLEDVWYFDDNPETLYNENGELI